ncbi:hypothetical protein GB931_20095 [Modestobacter sp. I12A-02628]|uniref:Uncharacterized protein n=1 Tax=Goekera deserti TaxID=2497753 RepID=A0A7K3W9T7_9ACTN|nr:hypothetical protein [Goekera deserti]MPR00173.1 hypothetical protein [Goekera deserti]NDI49347.1 hypothetical protein [Goekera deserti]NEL52779.1 hypothetical protein [Goekera deserti]
MLPDSARALKAELSQRLAEVPPGAVVARGSVDGSGWSGVALGLAPVAPGQVHLAVRLLARADAEVVLRGLGAAALAEVDVRVIGPVRPLTAPPPTGDDDRWSPARLQQRSRPLRPGISIGHPDVTAGTLGGFVRAPGRPGLLALSNDHVLAASDAAQVGDAVLQPGRADRGTPADRVGTLTAFQPFSPTGASLVDAAVAALDDGVQADPGDYPGGPLAPRVSDALDVDPDELVERVGRTTGHTRGRISAVEVDGVGVQYETAVFTFDDQVEIEGLTGGFSDGGDSGSVIWRSRDRVPVGLLFAGSSTGGSAGGGVTFANPLATVLSTLGVAWPES